MTKSDRRALESPPPREVVGFQQAFVDGLIPIVPERPPSGPGDLVEPSTAKLVWLIVLRLALTTGAVVVFTFVGVPNLELPFGIGPGLVVVLGLGWFVLIRVWIRQLGRRNLEEAARGYTTQVFWWGAISSSYSSRWSEVDGRIPWNHRGLWVLDRSFDVQSIPDRSIDPPGYYPSPHREGEWELWTGAVWTGTFRSTPFPRPDANEASAR